MNKLNRRIAKEFVKIIIALALMIVVFYIGLELNLSRTFFPVYIGKKYILWRQIVRYGMYVGLILIEVALGSCIAKCDETLQRLKRKKHNMKKRKEVQRKGR